MRFAVYQIILLIIFTVLCPAQNAIRELGIPPIQNYSPKIYGQHEQNWAVIQNRQGIIYIGNSHGLLEYDGTRWRYIHTTAPNIVRSIAINPRNEIYLGGYNYFGCLRTTPDGRFKFVVLSDSLNADKKIFGNVWNTISVNDCIYFQTDSALFRWSEDTISIWQTTFPISRSFVIRDTLYHVKKDTGLVYLDLYTDTFKGISGGETFAAEKIHAMINLNNKEVLIGTRGKGLFKYAAGNIHTWHTEIDDLLKDAKLTAMTCLQNGDIAIATILNGLYVINNEGKLLQHVDKQNGLIDNTVWNLYADNQGGLWLALNNGISRVELPAPITYFTENTAIEGTIESITRYRENIFIATPLALFYLNPQSEQLIINQVSSFRPYKLLSGKDFLLASGYTSGTYQYLNGGMQLISNYSGYSFYQSKTDTNRIYIGLDKGIAAIYRSQKGWIDEGYVELKTGPVRDIGETTDGDLWLGTSSDIVCKVVLHGKRLSSPETEITYFDNEHGLGSTDQTHVLSMDDQVLFANGNKLLTFDDKNMRFFRARIFQDTFADSLPAILDLVQDSDGNAWLFTSTGNRLETGVARYSAEGNYHWESTPFMPLADMYFYTIYPDPAQNGIIWFGGPDGLIKYNSYIAKNYDLSYRCLVRRVSAQQDSVLWTGIQYETNSAILPVLSYAYNSLRFEFSAPFFKNEDATVYQYMIEGFDQSWSAWTEERKANYTNIPEGKYVFKARARNVYGKLSKEAAFGFTILPPWYRTWSAYFAYALLGILLVIGLIRARSQKLEHEKQVLEQILAERTEEIQLKNSRLEEQAQKLQEMDEIKSRFFANISHEFRTPLTLIIGPIEEMIAGTFKGNHLKSFKTILQNAKRLLRLINQLLDLSKLESGSMKLQASSGKIAPFLKGILFSFSSYAEMKKIHLQYIDHQEDVELYFDRDKLEKIIFNLISNAFKYTPAGGYITLTMKSVSERMDSFPEGAVEVIIHDSGIGIEKDRLPTVFERFVQTDQPNSTMRAGSGIGLALTKELVELHHGKISIDSIPGEGTKCNVILPLGKAHLQQSEIIGKAALPDDQTGIIDLELAGLSDSTETTEKHVNMNNGSDEGQTIILIVEDNADVRSYIAAHLKDDYHIIEAADGREGLQKALDLIPDLIISDVMMPQLDGFQLTQNLKTNELTSHIPIILLTAKAGDKAKIEGLELGADDYMIKPFNAQELSVRIKNLINIRRELRHKYEQKIVYHPSEVNSASIDDLFMNRVCKMIEDHMADSDFKAETIQRKIAVSQRQFYRKIRALTGQTPGQFIRSMRLKRARQLLENNSGNISQIAYDVGFSNLSYFSKCFREQFGVLPSEV